MKSYFVLHDCDWKRPAVECLSRTPRIKTAMVLVLVLFLLCCSRAAQAQCPEILAIMVDACGIEHLNECMIIHSGGEFNTSQLQIDFDVNNNMIGAENNGMNTNNGNTGATPCGISMGNTAAYSECSNLIAVGSGMDITANSIVVFQNSPGSTAGLYNFIAPYSFRRMHRHPCFRQFPPLCWFCIS